MKIFDIISERTDAPLGTMGLTIFDIDDTLFHTTAKIKVIKNGQAIRTLTNQEFNNYQLQPDEKFDFGEFRNAEKFAKESQPIKPMINTLKRILDRATNTKVIMLTARADFDNKETFLNTFEKHGIDMSRVHVHRAGNLPGDEEPAYKKAIWVRKYLNTGKYNRVKLIDDSMTNLKVFKALKKEYPNVNFDAYFVHPSGSVTTLHESWKLSEKVGDVVQPVQAGDTVYSIARQNNLDPAELMKFNGFTINTKLKPGQEVKIPQKKSAASTTASKKSAPVVGQGAQPATITSSNLETTLRSFAIKAGIKGKELAQFLAQCAHETMNFNSLVELGDNFKNYDPKVNPQKAKTLGNTNPGDGERFKGRGYIQLTGRWNYTQAGQALGLPLDQKPQLLERPDVAAKASVWFWKNRVQPNVSNFTDTRAVTSYINPGLAGLQQRNGLFQNYLQTMQKPVKEARPEEDYHPNDTPPGAETKPTMPAGTVKVDVSDVYDWYKLGQHISNLKGLGKHDFGKGPPSTIISFGSEEEEHKYIQDLMKLGLATTDIDPVDPRQPKGMKRQKVDPTYNVGEDAMRGVIYTKPNFDFEWEEAERYPEFVKLGKDAWIELAKKGKAVTINSAKGINNTDAADPDSFKSLVPAKQKRALAQLEKGTVEMPIVAVYSDGHKELIGGNTRLTAMMAKNGRATVWAFRVPGKQGMAENFADGKNPQDKGDSKRHGIPKKASISALKKIRSSDTASPRKKQLAHWQINMRQGRQK
jgi:predicted chitinase